MSDQNCRRCDRTRLALWLVLVWLLVSTFATGGRLIVPTPNPITATDFTTYYAAGAQANAGEPEAAYDPDKHHRAEQAVDPNLILNWFFYPPTSLLLYAPLALLPFIPAFVVFEGTTLGLYLFLLWRILRPSRQFALGCLLALPSILWTVADGANAMLTASLLGFGTLLLERRPVATGLLFGALCYKPQFGLLVPVALIAGRHWRAFAAASSTAVGLCLSSLVLFGTKTWLAFVAAMPLAQWVYAHHMNPVVYVNAFGATLLLGFSPAIAYGVQAVASLVAAVLVALVWRRGGPLPVRAAVLLAGAIVAAPKCDYYELATVVVAAAWLLTTEERWRRPVLLGLFALTVNVVTPAAVWRVPLGLIVSLGALALAVSSYWSRRATGRNAQSWHDAVGKQE